VLSELFGYLCGQGRCFVIGGEPLPVCQRCLGVYVGAAVTMLWMLASGVFRHGLPPRLVAVIETVSLAAAMIGGLHALDVGPAWRMLCGLWTGHVAVVWLVGASVQLFGTGSSGGTHATRWRRGQIIQGAGAPVVLALFVLAPTHLRNTGWWFWTVVALVGLVAITVAAAVAIIAVAARALRFALHTVTTTGKVARCSRGPDEQDGPPLS
jgi:uncharacterized membrane protein